MIVAAALAAAFAECTSGGPSATPSRLRTDTGTEPRRGGPALAPCEERGDLLCGSIEVPLDRANRGAGTISVAFYVHRHTDTRTPPSEPIFATPGGPGSGGLDVMEVALGMGPILAHHDIVAIDPRGTGKSGAIDCPDLQGGWDGRRELLDAVSACGDQLGDAADRYGAGDVAMDVEALRQALGYDRIDYYAFSYGTVPEQAYAARFPQNLHALVFDAGVSVTDPAHAWAWGFDKPGALVREVALMCSRDPACPAPDPGPDVRWFVHRVATRPVRGAVERPGGDPEPVVVDERRVAALLQSAGTCVMCGQIDPVQLMTAVTSLRTGDPQPLLRLADLHSGGPGDRALDPAVFSVGDNVAAVCNDQDFVWVRTDPVSVRRSKFDEAVQALPSDAFAPFTLRGWFAFAWPGSCLTWPAPDRFEPAVPADAVVPDVPTLILAGDSDTIVPPELVEGLRREFPHATFVTVAGAAHPVTRSVCSTELVAQLFDRLTVEDRSCSTAPRAS